MDKVLALAEKVLNGFLYGLGGLLAYALFKFAGVV